LILLKKIKPRKIGNTWRIPEVFLASFNL